MTKDERRKMKLQLRREAKERMQQDYTKQESGKKMLLYGAVALVLLGGIGLFMALPKPEPVNYATGNIVFPLNNIHWHATPEIYVCGEKVPVPDVLPGKHLGSGLLHTHEDKLIHVEGTVSGPAQITLGAFMSSIGMKFSETQLLDKSNGDSCSNGEAGKVGVSVNGNPNNEFGNYVVRDGDRIEMRFG